MATFEIADSTLKKYVMDLKCYLAEFEPYHTIEYNYEKKLYVLVEI